MYLLAESLQIEEMDVDSSFESLATGKNDSIAMPTCIASVITGEIWSYFFSIVSYDCVEYTDLHDEIYIY